MRILQGLFFGVIFLMISVQTHAQQTLAPDSSNFISYFDKILIKLNLSSQTDQYALLDTKGSNLTLRANNEYKTFLSLDYEFIGFSYGFSPRIFTANNDDGLKGHSSFTDFKVQLFPGQFLQTLSFDKTKGYYVQNTGDFVSGWKENVDPYIQIPSLKNVQYGGSTSYVLNRNFSFKNLIYQTQWQKRSAGSFVPTLAYDYSRYSFDFAGAQSLQKDFNLRLGIGYYYTFIIAHRFYVSPNLVPSVGIRYSKYHSIQNGAITDESKYYFTRFLDGGIKFGFNSDRWVAGGGLNFNINWYNDGPSQIVENDKAYGILYFGYRFNTPGFINKTYKKLSEKVPL